MPDNQDPDPAKDSPPLLKPDTSDQDSPPLFAGASQAPVKPSDMQILHEGLFAQDHPDNVEIDLVPDSEIDVLIRDVSPDAPTITGEDEDDGTD